MAIRLTLYALGFFALVLLQLPAHSAGWSNKDGGKTGQLLLTSHQYGRYQLCMMEADRYWTSQKRRCRNNVTAPGRPLCLLEAKDAYETYAQGCRDRYPHR